MNIFIKEQHINKNYNLTTSREYILWENNEQTEAPPSTLEEIMNETFHK